MYQNTRFLGERNGTKRVNIFIKYYASSFLYLVAVRETLGF